MIRCENKIKKMSAPVLCDLISLQIKLVQTHKTKLGQFAKMFLYWLAVFRGYCSYLFSKFGKTKHIIKMF